MKKTTGFLSGMAALVFAIFTFAGAPVGAQTLSGTVWQGDITDSVGISRINFTSSTEADGDFGNYNHLYFTYVIDYTTGRGTLTETKTLYSSNFVLSGNTLTFPTGIRPFGMSTLVYAEIEIEYGLPLENLTDTNWLGMAGKMGETLLNNVVYDPLFGTGTLDCTVGPNTPMIGLSFSYTYNGSTGGTGTVTTLGAFTTTDSTDTMVFSNFMGTGTAATFELFEYLP